MGSIDRSNVPEVVHIHGNSFRTMIEDPSINWPETSMEPHFPELVSFNLENNAVIKVFIRSFDLILKSIISGSKYCSNIEKIVN